MDTDKKQSYSISPAGEKFALPNETDYAIELARIEKLVALARSEKKEIVVVMGLGFVGAVMAAIVADTKDASGMNSKFVIGCQRPSSRSFWKIPMINRGEAPVKAEDPEVAILIERCVLQDKTFVATY
ncbi:MAG: GDP-mannose dehydrogenase, partial [Bacteroidota bacterium]